MRISLFYFLSLLLLVSCFGSRKTKQTEKADLRPEWVKERPVVPGEYIGIGMSAKSYGSDFRESARKNALGDMSSQIEVNISVNSLLHTISTDTRYQQEFRSLTKTTTQLQLEGYELAGAWESETEYWMYYRMPVSVYQESRRQRIQAAREQSLDLLRKGDELKRTGAVPAAMGYYTRALEALKPFMNEPLQADYDGKQIYLANEVLKAINEGIRNLSFKVDPTKIQVVTSRGVNVPIKIEVRFNEGGFPAVSGLPLKVDFTKGDGVISGTLTTNPAGICELRLTGLATAEAAQEIVVKPDIEKMMVKDAASKIWYSMADTRQAPVVPIPLTVLTPLVFVDTKEFNLDQVLPSPRMSSFIQQELSRSGIRFTEDISVADFILSIQASTKALGEFNGMFSSGLNAEIKLSDIRTRQAMTTQVIADIRGVQLNYIRAGEDAYFKAESEIRRRVVPALNKVLLGR